MNFRLLQLFTPGLCGHDVPVMTQTFPGDALALASLFWDQRLQSGLESELSQDAEELTRKRLSRYLMVFNVAFQSAHVCVHPLTTV